MINNLSLHQIVPLGSLLRPTRTGFDGSFTGDFTYEVSFSVTDAELNQLHPNLSRALRIIALDDLVVSQKAVMNVLTLWGCGIYLVHKYGTPIAVFDATNFSIVEGNLFIEGISRTYVEDIFPGCAEPIKLPDTKGYSRAEIDSVYLDQHYPGWAARLSIAKDLGLGAMDALKSALTEVYSNVPVAIPDAIFYDYPV